MSEFDEEDDAELLKLDHDVIREMKRQGMAKPTGVAESDWREPDQMNHRHDEIITLMLQGLTKRKIAEQLGMNYNYLVTISNSAIFRSAYAEERKLRNLPIDRKRVAEMFEEALLTVESVMLNPDEKGATRLDAAKFVVEQAVGKAKQDVEVKGSVLMDVIHSIEQLKAAREATATPELDKPRSAVDAFVEDYIPEAMTVGKRGADGPEET
jgi:hypothetical protein